jgi:hypothetical protein
VYIGYDHFEGVPLQTGLARVYRSPVPLLNFFMPAMNLESKVKAGSKESKKEGIIDKPGAVIAVDVRKGREVLMFWKARFLALFVPKGFRTYPGIRPGWSGVRPVRRRPAQGTAGFCRTP